MTLAPDHLAYTTNLETGDPAPLVSVIPDRDWANLTLPPEDAPGKDNLPLARDIILAHLNDGTEAGDPWELTWAAIAIDLNNPRAIPIEDARRLVINYATWSRLHGGTDWTPGDADELRTEITRHLTAAGYREGN